MYKEKKPLYVDPFDFQAHMFSIRWVIRLDHLLIFDRLMLTITVYVDRRESSGVVEMDKPEETRMLKNNFEFSISIQKALLAGF